MKGWMDRVVVLLYPEQLKAKTLYMTWQFCHMHQKHKVEAKMCITLTYAHNLACVPLFSEQLHIYLLPLHFCMCCGVFMKIFNLKHYLFSDQIPGFASRPKIPRTPDNDGTSPHRPRPLTPASAPAPTFSSSSPQQSSRPSSAGSLGRSNRQSEFLCSLSLHLRNGYHTNVL